MKYIDPFGPIKKKEPEKLPFDYFLNVGTAEKPRRMNFNEWLAKQWEVIPHGWYMIVCEDTKLALNQSRFHTIDQYSQTELDKYQQCTSRKLEFKLI